MLLVIVLPCFVNAVLSRTCGTPQVSPDRLYNPVQRIVGGVIAGDRSWPAIAALINAKHGYASQHFCGGTLISSQWILTASHCVDRDPEDVMVQDFRVVVGIEDLVGALERPSENYRIISRVIKHQDYSPLTHQTGPSNDIALIKLDQPVTLSDDIQPACLPSASIYATDPNFTINKQNQRRVCFAAGWGHQHEGQQPMYVGGSFVHPASSTLRQVDIEMYSFADCKEKLKSYRVGDMTSMICGGFNKAGKDACQGDSGGPLMCKNGYNVWELAGVVSSGPGCGKANLPGIYANVEKYRSWIQHTVNFN